MSQSVLEWEDRVLSKYVLKHGPLCLTQKDRQIIFDWLASDIGSRYHSRLIRLTVPMVFKLAASWLNSLENNLIKETSFDIAPILDCSNSFQWVELRSAEAYYREGVLMSHCVNSFANKPYSIVYSLRDKKNQPHCTIEVEDNYFDATLGSVICRINQIAGKTNKSVSVKYRKQLISILNLLIEKGYVVEQKLLNRHNLILKDNCILDISELSNVEGDLDLSNFTGDMPENLEVSGNLFFTNAMPQKLSTSLKVAGIMFVNNKDQSFPKLWQAHSIIEVSVTPDILTPPSIIKDFT